MLCRRDPVSNYFARSGEKFKNPLKKISGFY